MLDLVERQPRFFSDGLEGHRPIVRTPLENGLDECHQADLLSKEGIVFLKNDLSSGGESQKMATHEEMTNLSGEERYQGLEFANVTFVEREQQFLYPIERSIV
jgi:hypothetical protein